MTIERPVLPEALIVDCAQKLGAFNVPIRAIQAAWESTIVDCVGCLNNENGQRLFIAYRLRELGCFAVGCKDDMEQGTGCFLHFFDIYANTKSLTDAEYAAFMNGRSTESSVAATKLWKLTDSRPVNALAARSTYFNRDKKPNRPETT